MRHLEDAFDLPDIAVLKRDFIIVDVVDTLLGLPKKMSAGFL